MERRIRPWATAYSIWCSLRFFVRLSFSSYNCTRRRGANERYYRSTAFQYLSCWRGLCGNHYPYAGSEWFIVYGLGGDEQFANLVRIDCTVSYRGYGLFDFTKYW